MFKTILGTLLIISVRVSGLEYRMTWEHSGVVFCENEIVSSPLWCFVTCAVTRIGTRVGARVAAGTSWSPHPTMLGLPSGEDKVRLATRFIIGLSAHNCYLEKMLLARILIYYFTDVIRSLFCAWYKSWAVVTCTKLTRYDLFSTSEQHVWFYNILIKSLKPCMVRVSVTCITKAKVHCRKIFSQ